MVAAQDNASVWFAKIAPASARDKGVVGVGVCGVRGWGVWSVLTLLLIAFQALMRSGGVWDTSANSICPN